ISSARMADVDGAVLGARAAAKARAAENPPDLDPGRYEVVLEPTAAEDIVSAFAFHGFDGRSVTEGLSFLEVGKDQLDAAVWLVENGEIVRPVRNLRFTQSYPQALGPGQVLGVGSHAVTMPDDYIPSALAAPALHLASWNFTGNASG